jgi:hypothetical protein
MTMNEKNLPPAIRKSIADAKAKGKSFDQWREEWNVSRDTFNAVRPSNVPSKANG